MSGTRSALRFVGWAATAALALAGGCAELGAVVGPDGERLTADECLLTVGVGDSCVGCEGFERYDVEVLDAAGDAWTFAVAAGETWIEVIARGEVHVELVASLYGNPYPYGEPVIFTCERSYELEMGCLGFDFCTE